LLPLPLPIPPPLTPFKAPLPLPLSFPLLPRPPPRVPLFTTLDLLLLPFALQSLPLLPCDLALLLQYSQLFRPQILSNLFALCAPRLCFRGVLLLRLRAPRLLRRRLLVANLLTPQLADTLL